MTFTETNKGSNQHLCMRSFSLKCILDKETYIYAFVLHSIDRRIKCCKDMFQIQMHNRVHCQISIPKT